MQRAVELARRARPLASPNPPVGAVLVKDGSIIGEGFTQPVGQPHAEIMALQQAGTHARGAALYVTLEPCSHWGRTPPCVDAIIAAQVARVHIAVLDPNPRVNGEGWRRLREHGIEVATGEGTDQATELVEAHAKYIIEGKPFVTLLMTAPPAVEQELRASTDAVITDRAFSHATPRGQPSRCVARYSSEGDPMMDKECPPTTAGRVIRLSRDVASCNLGALVTELGRRGITSCVVAGSRALGKAFLGHALVDKIVAGSHSQPPVGFVAASTLWPSTQIFYPLPGGDQ